MRTHLLRISLVVASFGLLSDAIAKGGESTPLFDMTAIRDASTLEVEVMDDWHVVSGLVTTRQKHITIHVGEIWKGQPLRVPVRLVVPVDGKAKGFHLTGGHNPQRLERDARLNPEAVALLRGGVGLVQTVVQEFGQMGLRELGRESESRFMKSLNPHDKIQYWAWPAILMRSVTAAYAETDHFEVGKVAMSGGSKNGASPSMAIIHDERMTAVHASLSPIWDSPLRLCDRQAWKKLERYGPVRHPFLGGHYGPLFNRRAMKVGRTWDDLQQFAERVSDDVFVSRNLEKLGARKVDMLFEPGTHDFVAFDVAWGGEHHPSIPVYLRANTGHSMEAAHRGTEHEQNRTAFLLNHFFDEVPPLLSPPSVEHEIKEGELFVRVEFPPDSGDENGRIWWIYDRPDDGSPAFLEERIPDKNWQEMQRDEAGKAWTCTIELNVDASRIDFFSSHRKRIRYQEKVYRSCVSCPYTRVQLK